MTCRAPTRSRITVSQVGEGVDAGVSMHQYYLPLLQAHRTPGLPAACPCTLSTDRPMTQWALRYRLNLHAADLYIQAVTVGLSSSAPQIHSHDFWRYINLHVCMYMYE